MSSQIPTKTEPKHFAYLDAVRGYAFLGVLCTHVASLVGAFPWRWLPEQGAFGVQLFFLASAITLCQSMQARQKVDAHPVLFFYLRRLFRIAPLFWAAMVFYWLFPKVMPTFWLTQYAPEGVHSSYFFLTAFFLHGWHPYTLNSIVPGGWSIAVEMTFYAFFPIIFFCLNSLKRTAVAALLGLVVIEATLAKWGYAWTRQQFFPAVPDKVWEYFSAHWFPAQLTVFLTGFLVWRLLDADRVKTLVKDRFWAAWLLAFAFFILLNLLHGIRGGFVDPANYIVLALAGIIIAISGGALVLCINPLVCHLGKISYSCYLAHFAALGLTMKLLGLSFSPEAAFFDTGQALTNLLLFVKIITIALLMTAAIATVTYHLIETPGIALGRKTIARLSTRAK